MKGYRVILLLFCGALLASCASAPPYRYHYIPGKTAYIQNGQIVWPAKAPQRVREAIAAGNALQGKPYIYGGGHRYIEDVGYDCSGSVSYVLYHAGLLSRPEASDEFRSYGRSGPGDWITVYAARGHVFIVIAGLRLDTGYTGGSHDGPLWSAAPRPAKGCVLRHPPGF